MYSERTNGFDAKIVAENKRIPLLGLTGSMAAGKSTAARTIAEMGFPIIDADRIAHEVLEDEKVISELVKEFGSGIISDGRIDRKAQQHHPSRYLPKAHIRCEA